MVSASDTTIKKIQTFNDISVAFSTKNNSELRLSYLIFFSMSHPKVVKILSNITKLALKLHFPVSWIIKRTVYRQFCGGETVEECMSTVEKLGHSHIGAILDYSAEGQKMERNLDCTQKEMIKIVEIAGKHRHIPCIVMKLTGLGRIELYEKVSLNKPLTETEQKEYSKVKTRVDSICAAASKVLKPVYIDAEESWIQPAIDVIAEEMMLKYNRQYVVVFTTTQMYRHDRLDYLRNLINYARKNNFKLGIKIVRGAYLEKENKRAVAMGYKTPIYSFKKDTDNAFDEAVKISVDNIDVVELCAGTHNEESCLSLMKYIEEKSLPRGHKQIWFSQLYGMGDNISYNLAKAGYNVSKYLPYGPVKSAVPYLIRRAEENTAIAGQMGKELALIISEMKRRKRQIINEKLFSDTV